jgi:hypothetical protein
VREIKGTDAGHGSMHDLNIGFSKDGPDFYLEARYQAFIKSPPVETSPDTPMTIKLGDGSELSLYPVSEARAKRQFVMGSWNRKKTKTTYGLKKEDIERLAAVAIQSVEFSYRADDEMRAELFSVNPENGEVIRAHALCMMK